MARLWRNQGQVHPDGESQVDRNGLLNKTDQLCWECLFSKALFPQQMERFKIVERETKTKAYSKEVLKYEGKLVYFFCLRWIIFSLRAISPLKKAFDAIQSHLFENFPCLIFAPCRG